jgi:hypothetical protein
LPDFGSRETRERLSPAALKAFFNTMARWKVRDEDARVLLGGVTNGPFYEMKRHPERTLDADRLTRISYVIGIFKALGVLYSEPLADVWVQRPNTNPLFAGATPLQYMMRGGLPAMQNVRRLLDARRAG